MGDVDGDVAVVAAVAVDVSGVSCRQEPKCS